MSYELRVMSWLSPLFLLGLIFLLFGCRVKRQEQKQERLEVVEQVQAVRIATKEVERVILRLDSLSLVVADFDTLGRITSLTTAKHGTKTIAKEQETAQDSLQAKGKKQVYGNSEQFTESERSSPFAVPKAFYWLIGGVVLLLIVALVLRLLRK